MQPFELLFKITERLLKNCLLFMKNNKISFRLKRVQECKPHHTTNNCKVLFLKPTVEVVAFPSHLLTMTLLNPKRE